MNEKYVKKKLKLYKELMTKHNDDSDGQENREADSSGEDRKEPKDERMAKPVPAGL